MTITRQIATEKKRAIVAAFSIIVIVTLLGVYAFFVNPIFKPSKVTITGTVTAPGVTLSKIAFTNTGCGTRNEAAIFSNGETSGTYTISLDNEYSYNVSIVWNSREVEGALVEAEIGTLVLDTFNQSLVRNWTVQS